MTENSPLNAPVPATRKRVDWRRIILALVFVGLVWLVYDRRHEAMEIGRTMQQADSRWLLVAALLQFCYFMLYSEMYRWAFATVEIPGKPLSMLSTLLGSLVVGMVAPAWSAAGTALFVDDAIRRGQTPARATTATLLAHTIDFSGFSIVLISGLVTLYLRHKLNPLILGFSTVFFLFTLGMIGVLLSAQIRPQWVRHLLGVLQRQATRLFAYLKRPAPLAEDWADETTREFGEAACSVRAHPFRALFALLSILAAHLVSATCLYCLFLAYNVPDGIRVGPLVAGYSTATLATIMSPIPGGIGVAETTMKAVLNSVGVSDGAATLIVITFRGLNFWLPLAVGFFVVGQMRSFRSRKPEA